jgi:predicted metalloprotease
MIATVKRTTTLTLESDSINIAILEKGDRVGIKYKALKSPEVDYTGTVIEIHDNFLYLKEDEYGTTKRIKYEHIIDVYDI